jgi:hypothetical protein
MAGIRSLPFRWIADSTRRLRFEKAADRSTFVQPDAILMIPGTVFLIEAETGTQTIVPGVATMKGGSTIAKVERYGCYVTERIGVDPRSRTAFARDFGERVVPRLVILVKTATRRASVLEGLEQHRRKNRDWDSGFPPGNVHVWAEDEAAHELTKVVSEATDGRLMALGKKATSITAADVEILGDAFDVLISQYRSLVAQKRLSASEFPAGSIDAVNRGTAILRRLLEECGQAGSKPKAAQMATGGR